MTCRKDQDFQVRAGETFTSTVRWGDGTLTSKAITAITQTAPAAVTATAHGLPSGWRCAVVGAKGMTEINAGRYPPDVWHTGVPSDVNTVALSDVSSADYSAYVSGGYLVYETPKDLTGVTATLSVYDSPDHSGTPLLTLTSGVGITIDNANKTITPLLQTAGLLWTTGYYRLDATESSGVVTELLRGIIDIAP